LLVALALIACSCAGAAPRESATPSPTPRELSAAGHGTEPAAAPLLPPGASINPLTGQPVADPSLLDIPAVLISISHFPATARPQAGLSFAPFVYEYYITEGATRFLAVFYGEFPAVETVVHGGCETRTGSISRTENILGNLVWLDADGNGIQDPGEGGIAGLCVNLYDSAGNLIRRTSTDSNGFYAFNVSPGRYSVEFVAPENLRFTRPHEGDASTDSDADLATGRADVGFSADDLSVDAGLVPAPGRPLPTEDPSSLPLAQVGPIRSGRLIYRYIAHYFENSCLIFASASPEVLVELPECLTVFHQISGGGFMLDLDEMEAVARKNARQFPTPFNYSGNRFDPAVPSGGMPATQLKVVIAYQNQSGWHYDAASQSYLRYVDTSEYEQAGVLHPEVDRLTGRQLHFENLIVLYAKHDVISPTNLDIHLDPGRTGKALLLRDGKLWDITWETTSAKQESVGPIRPIRFLGADGQAAPLRPGHTWILVVTPETTVEQTQPGRWLLAFAQPPGAK
jgi:SdrD B-like domain/Protein of unknown function (DUF3048) C-terminal domain/Protein of unknown function (DUF3048) N-terminal domain